MLLKNGIIKVMDFGIAKLPNTETVTMTEKAIGTVYYISPEQVSGGEIDSRSDIYSLGVMMYEMATGQLPFTAETPVSVALMQVNDAPTQPRNLNSHIPIGLEQIIMRAMEKVPGERYQSAEEMLGHLLKLRENPKIIFRENRTAKDKKKEADEAKPRRRASRSMFPIIIGVTMAFLIVAGISGYYILDKLFLNSTMNDYENVEIENFVGATYTLELDAWFEKSEYFEMPTIEYEYNDKIGKGRIISQNPLPKEIRKVLPGKQKCEISFVVSLGEKTFTLEDYTVRDYRVVETELRRLGLRVTVDNVESDVFDIGAVVKTEPAAGTVVKEDDHVTIYVSVGVKTAKTTVPNFVGLNEAEALVLLMESKLSAGEVKYVKGSYAVGTVVEQTIPAWTEAIQHTKVGFTVCGGESYSGDGTSLPTEDDMKPIEPDPIEPDPVDPDDPDNPVDPDDPNIDDTDPDETDDPFDWGNTDDSGYDNPVFKDPDDWFNGGIWGGSDFYGNGYVP